MKNGECSKALFITFNNIDGSFGGAQCSRRNLNLLKEKMNVEVYSISKRSSYESIKSGLSLLFPPLSFSDKEDIINKLNFGGFSLVFLDSSLLGTVAEWIKEKFRVPIITFFHNVEIDYIKVRFNKNLLGLPYGYLAKINEKKAIKYSDKIIVLNNRDDSRLQKIYKRTSDMIIPITFEDRIGKEKILAKYSGMEISERKKCLFVGAISNSNYSGIKWFIENVSYHIDADIIVAGTGFEKKVEELTRDNVEIMGYVENLENLYLQSDFVISPLLFGGGMKVKIAEAMMYGKTIFATSEAFEGYDIDLDRIGGLCESAEDFVSKITQYLKDANKFNIYSRSVYEEKYSHQVAADKLNFIIESL